MMTEMRGGEEEEENGSVELMAYHDPAAFLRGLH